jgi:predicted esterase
MRAVLPILLPLFLLASSPLPSTAAAWTPILDWQLLGPFPVGKSEFDGNPIHEFPSATGNGSTRSSPRGTEPAGYLFVSELSHGGEAGWAPLRASGDGTVHVHGGAMRPRPVDFNSHIQQASKLSIAEHQSLLVAQIDVPAPLPARAAAAGSRSTILLRCRNVHTVVVDEGRLHHADIYGDTPHFAIPLTAGPHRIRVRLRAKAQARFRCETSRDLVADDLVAAEDLGVDDGSRAPTSSFSASSTVMRVLPASAVPDIHDGQLAGRIISIPVTNMMLAAGTITDGWLRNVKCSHVRTIKIRGSCGGKSGKKTKKAKKKAKKRKADDQCSTHIDRQGGDVGGIATLFKVGEPQDEMARGAATETEAEAEEGNEGNEEVEEERAEMDSAFSPAPFTAPSSVNTSIAPGQILPIHVHLRRGPSFPTGGLPADDIDQCVTLLIVITGTALREEDGASLMVKAAVQVTLRCRRANQSFVLTFIDHDGAVAEAAAIRPRPPPLPRPPSSPSSPASPSSPSRCGPRGCPVVLTLSGVGVPARDQADAYKYVPPSSGVGGGGGNDFVFGLQGAWVLSPGRFGAHNWEGGVRWTCLASLRALANLHRRLGKERGERRSSSAEDEEAYLAHKWRPDTTRIVYAGHSRGGHGALVLATHRPDQALGVVAAHGWIQREYYGDANLIFEQDVSLAHVDPSLKALITSAIYEVRGWGGGGGGGGIANLKKTQNTHKEIYFKKFCPQ